MLKEKLKTVWTAIKNSISDFFRRKNPAEFFVVFMAASLLLLLVCALFGGKRILENLFFQNGEDLFMDYFNSVRDVAQGEGVYTERHVIYPPMANLVFLICRQFVPDKYAHTSFDDRYSWTEYPSAVFSCVLLFCLFFLLFFLMLKKYVRLKGKIKAFFLFFLLINVPHLYLFERGNIILLSTLFTAVYVFTYDSESKKAREIGLISLALAFSLKLYPAVLGWMLLADKRYKDAGRCAVYGLAFLLLPSFLFGGPSCLVQMAKNIIAFSSGKGGWNFFTNVLHMPKTLQTAALFLCLAVSVGFFILSSFLDIERWKMWTFAFALLSAVPSVNALYSWATFLIPLIMLCGKKEMNGTDFLYFVCIVLPFLFLPEIFPNPMRRFLPTMTINSIITHILPVPLLILCIVDTCIALGRRNKEKKNLQANLF